MAARTALALQINRRFSYDFDFFTSAEFSANIFSQRKNKIKNRPTDCRFLCVAFGKRDKREPRSR